MGRLIDDLTKLEKASPCPRCNHRTFRVVDSRFSQGIKRRRRVCSSCAHKATTYEISSADFELLKKARQVQSIFFNPKRKQQKNCESCQEWKSEGCSYGFPEAGGAFAQECSLYSETK